jgi:hypothetical protein
MLWLLLQMLRRFASRLLHHWLLLHTLRRFSPWLPHHLRLRTRLLNHLRPGPRLLDHLRLRTRLLDHLRLRTRFAFNLRRQRMPFWFRHFTLHLLLRASRYTFALRLLFLLLNLHTLRLLCGALLIELLLALILLELLHLPARVPVALRGPCSKLSLLFIYPSCFLPLVLKVQVFMPGLFRDLIEPHDLRQILAERRRRRRHTRNHARLEKFLRNAWRQIDLAASPR